MAFIGLIIYIGLGLLQFAGTWAFFREVCDLNFFVCMLLTPVLGVIPGVGTILGMIGAAEGWRIGYLWAAVIYFGPFILSIALSLLGRLSRDEV